MSNAPIILFVYNRPGLTLKTLTALSKNIDADNSNLFIFSDGPKNDKAISKINEVRKIIENVKGFNKVEIIASPKNKGLANSIITGVSQIINIYEKVIVLEDDLISAPNFLLYMNKALEFYKNDSRVYTIHGYCGNIKLPKNYKYDTYFVPTRTGSWGWATWKNVWNKVDWDLKDIDSFFGNKEQVKKFNYLGNDLTKMLKRQIAHEIDTWDAQLCYHLLKNNAYSIYPVNSKIQNNGTGEVGTHNTYTNYFDVDLINSEQIDFNFANNPDENMIINLKSFLDYNNSKLNKISQLIKSNIRLKFGKK